MKQNKATKILSVTLVFICYLFLAIFYFTYKSQDKSGQILETSGAEYIYDEETDILAIHETTKDKLTLIDLNTKEQIFQAGDSSLILFYIPGKYIAVNQEKFYDLANRQEFLLTEVSSLDYQDSKVELKNRLQLSKNNGAEIYSDNRTNFYAFLIKEGSNASFYQAYEEAADFSQFSHMLALPSSNFYPKNLIDFGFIRATDGLKFHGVEGYSFQIKDTSVNIVGGGTRSQTWTIYKDGQQFSEVKISGKKYPLFILPFAQNRKEILTMNQFGIWSVILP